MVGWSSWLWHMLNTHNVPSSILGSIISTYFFGCTGIILFGQENQLVNDWKLFKEASSLLPLSF